MVISRAHDPYSHHTQVPAEVAALSPVEPEMPTVVEPEAAVEPEPEVPAENEARTGRRRKGRPKTGNAALNKSLAELDDVMPDDEDDA